MEDKKIFLLNKFFKTDEKGSLFGGVGTINKLAKQCRPLCQDFKDIKTICSTIDSKSKLIEIAESYGLELTTQERMSKNLLCLKLASYNTMGVIDIQEDINDLVGENLTGVLAKLAIEYSYEEPPEEHPLWWYREAGNDNVMYYVSLDKDFKNIWVPMPNVFLEKTCVFTPNVSLFYIASDNEKLEEYTPEILAKLAEWYRNFSRQFEPKVRTTITSNKTSITIKYVYNARTNFNNIVWKSDDNLKFMWYKIEINGMDYDIRKWTFGDSMGECNINIVKENNRPWTEDDSTIAILGNDEKLLQKIIDDKGPINKEAVINIQTNLNMLDMIYKYIKSLDERVAFVIVDKIEWPDGVKWLERNNIQDIDFYKKHDLVKKYNKLLNHSEESPYNSSSEESEESSDEE